MKRKTWIYSILRWLAILPASIIIAYFLGWILPILYNIVKPSPDSFWSFADNIYVGWCVPCAQGIASVWIGYWVAPSYKKVVAIILGSIHLILGLAFFIAVDSAILDYLNWGLNLNVALIANVVGAVGMAYWIFNDDFDTTIFEKGGTNKVDKHGDGINDEDDEDEDEDMDDLTWDIEDEDHEKE